MQTTLIRSFTTKEENGTYSARVVECLPPGQGSPVLWSATGFANRSAAMNAAKRAQVSA